jgi:N6-L-threonylcarbamoyladenine synthase
MKYFLGIDTSNYRTSVAVCDENGKIIKSVRRLLEVKEGERGLRQSDALFAHTKALPSIFEEIGEYPLHAVGYSEKPRDCEGSYMPCFLAGKSAAYAIASLSGVPVFPFSHQAGHIAAAIYSCKCDFYNIIKVTDSGFEDFDNSLGTSDNSLGASDNSLGASDNILGAFENKSKLFESKSEISEDGRFIAFHLSGGTTEALLYDNGKIKILGKTLDLNAGQVIDRVGVEMGLKFPAGEEMETLALGYPLSKGIKISVKGFDCNLAGIENMAKKLYAESGDRGLAAAFALDAVYKTVDKMTKNILEEYSGLSVLYAGGVTACKRIRERLEKDYKCFFASPEYSGDNAAGTALLCRREFLGRSTGSGV